MPASERVRKPMTKQAPADIDLRSMYLPAVAHRQPTRPLQRAYGTPPHRFNGTSPYCFTGTSPHQSGSTLKKLKCRYKIETLPKRRLPKSILKNRSDKYNLLKTDYILMNTNASRHRKKLVRFTDNSENCRR